MGALEHSQGLTPEAYLLAENDHPGGIRHEYVNGQTYAMAGASRNHNRIASALSARLFTYLENSPCEVFQSDMKVGIKTHNKQYFYYPDIQVSCEEEEDRYYNQAPCLIIEVLSDSTARVDRFEKLAIYQKIPSLQEYVLCAQESPSIEIYRRRTQWQPEHYTRGDTIRLESIGFDLPLDSLYGFLIE